MTETKRICVGVITGSFGVRGEVRLKSFCAEPAAIADYSPLQSEDGSASYAVTLTRPVKGGFAARLSGLKSKEQADALRGTKLFADRGILPNLPDEEFYHSDLVGLSVVDTGGDVVGKISAVHNHGAGDLLDINGGAGGQILLPFTAERVPTVDLASGRVIVDLSDAVETDGKDG